MAVTTALLTNKGRVARLHYHSMCVRSPGRLTVYIVSERGLEPGFSVMTRTAVRTFERRRYRRSVQKEACPRASTFIYAPLLYMYERGAYTALQGRGDNRFIYAKR